MCIIIAAPAGKHVKGRYLKNSWEANDDGAGIMYHHKKEVHIIKGLMTFKDFIEAWKSIPEDRARVAHFRIGTHGKPGPVNTHPFEIVKGRLALAHNGILPIKAEGDMSDTATFVEYVLKRLPGGWHRSPAMLHLLDNYCGTGNKFAIMDETGKVTLVNEDAGTWEEGVWFSNYTFRTGGSRYTGTTYFGGHYNAQGYEYGDDYEYTPGAGTTPAGGVDRACLPGPGSRGVGVGVSEQAGAPPATGAAGGSDEDADGSDDPLLVNAAIEAEFRSKAAEARKAGFFVEADKLQSSADALADERIHELRAELARELRQVGAAYDKVKCDELRLELNAELRSRSEVTRRTVKETHDALTRRDAKFDRPYQGTHPSLLPGDTHNTGTRRPYEGD